MEVKVRKMVVALPTACVGLFLTVYMVGAWNHYEDRWRDGLVMALSGSVLSGIVVRFGSRYFRTARFFILVCLTLVTFDLFVLVRGVLAGDKWTGVALFFAPIILAPTVLSSVWLFHVLFERNTSAG
jgi:hypothetical protein